MFAQKQLVGVIKKLWLPWRIETLLPSILAKYTCEIVLFPGAQFFVGRVGEHIHSVSELHLTMHNDML